MKHSKMILLFSPLLLLAGCGSQSVEYSSISGYLKINFKKTAQVKGLVEQYSKDDKSDLNKTEFTTLYYGNGMRYTASTNSNVSTDVLSCTYSTKGTASTYSYDFLKKEYLVQNGSTSFVPTFTSLETKLADYSAKAEAHKVDADSYSCTTESFNVSYAKIPIVLDTQTKLKLVNIVLSYSEEYLTAVDYTTNLSGVFTHYQSTYKYEALTDLAKTDLPDTSTWTQKE